MRSVALLTITGILSQLVGFVYRVFLTRMAGAEILGLYQLILPIYSVLLSLTSVGLTTAVSNLSARYEALDNRRAVLHIYQSSSRETLERYYRQTILTAITDFVHMMAQGLDVPEGKITALSRFYAAALEGLTSQWLRDGMTEDLAPFLADLGELLDGNIRLSLERCVRKEN